MSLTGLAVRALILTVLIGRICLAADNKPSGTALLAQAAALQNIHEKGAPPFQLGMRIHAEHIVSKPVDGAYAEVWMAPDKWRREIAFPGFNQLETGDVDSKWLSRNLEYRPRVVYLTEVALEAFLRPGLTPQESVKSMRNKKVRGTEAQCAELLQKGGHPRELCFDASGVLISESRGIQRFEYGDFSKFAGKIFPKSIRIYEEDKRVLEISADDLIAPSSPRPELFQHGTGARQLASCERWLTEPIKKVVRHYPQDARNQQQQGNVILYVSLSADGLVEKITLLQSAGGSLDQSAMEAVKQWVYPPPVCDAVSLATEIQVQVNYSLRPY